MDSFQIEDRVLELSKAQIFSLSGGRTFMNLSDSDTQNFKLLLQERKKLESYFNYSRLGSDARAYFVTRLFSWNEKGSLYDCSNKTGIQYNGEDWNLHLPTDSEVLMWTFSKFIEMNVDKKDERGLIP